MVYSFELMLIDGKEIEKVYYGHALDPDAAPELRMRGSISGSFVRFSRRLLDALYWKFSLKLTPVLSSNIGFFF